MTTVCPSTAGEATNPFIMIPAKKSQNSRHATKSIQTDSALISCRGSRNIKAVTVQLTAMKLFVGVTDNDWFALHASRPFVDEMNFGVLPRDPT
jgi:hypothetical protein